MSLASLPPTTYAKDGRVYLAPSCEKLGALAFQLDCLWNEESTRAEDATAFPGMVLEVVDFLSDLVDRAAEELRGPS